MSGDWYYLSFADDSGFLGGLYVEAANEMEAFFSATARKLNPGGEVMMWGPLPVEDMDVQVPLADRYRLLTKEEVQAQ